MNSTKVIVNAIRELKVFSFNELINFINKNNGIPINRKKVCDILDSDLVDRFYDTYYCRY